MTHMSTVQTLLSAIALLGAPQVVFSQSFKDLIYICESGTPFLPKHLQSFLGDASKSIDKAADSALNKCKMESPIPIFCHRLACYEFKTRGRMTTLRYLPHPTILGLLAPPRP